MKAIVCKYIGPSNVRGSRIKAFAEGGNSVTIGYPHELSGSDVYRLAADTLCKKLKWEGELIEGGLPNGDCVFVFAPKISHYLCKACGKTGPDHGHYDSTDPNTHKFICGEAVYL
jgi:hypothetical protein